MKSDIKINAILNQFLAPLLRRGVGVRSLNDGKSNNDFRFNCVVGADTGHGCEINTILNQFLPDKIYYSDQTFSVEVPGPSPELVEGRRGVEVRSL